LVVVVEVPCRNTFAFYSVFGKSLCTYKTF
jgi:hypothetical protein